MRFRVTLFTTQVQKTTLDKLDAAIVSLMRAADGLATHEVAEERKPRKQTRPPTSASKPNCGRRLTPCATTWTWSSTNTSSSASSS